LAALIVVAFLVFDVYVTAQSQNIQLIDRFERLEVSSLAVNEGENSWVIAMTVMNTGASDATIDGILLDGKPLSQYTRPFLNLTYEPASGLVAAGASGMVTIGVGSRDIPPFTAGDTLELSIHTFAGRYYPQVVKLSSASGESGVTDPDRYSPHQNPRACALDPNPPASCAAR
jgi:hypothetical protein